MAPKIRKCGPCAPLERPVAPQLVHKFLATWCELEKGALSFYRSVHHSVRGNPPTVAQYTTCTAMSSGPNPSGIRYTVLPNHLPTLAVVYRDIFSQNTSFWHSSLFFFFFFDFWLHWVFVVVWGLSLVMVHGLLIAVVSLVAEHRL